MRVYHEEIKLKIQPRLNTSPYSLQEYVDKLSQWYSLPTNNSISVIKTPHVLEFLSKISWSNFLNANYSLSLENSGTKVVSKAFGQVFWNQSVVSK